MLLVNPLQMCGDHLNPSPANTQTSSEQPRANALTSSEQPRANAPTSSEPTSENVQRSLQQQPTDSPKESPNSNTSPPTHTGVSLSQKFLVLVIIFVSVGIFLYAEWF